MHGHTLSTFCVIVLLTDNSTNISPPKFMLPIDITITQINTPF